MGLRFYRRFKILPGVSINLSKTGASVSMGRRGAHLTIGPRGTRETVGIPGTGISYTATQKNPGRIPARAPSYRRLLLALAIAAIVLLIHWLAPAH